MIKLKLLVPILALIAVIEVSSSSPLHPGHFGHYVERYTVIGGDQVNIISLFHGGTRGIDREL